MLPGRRYGGTGLAREFRDVGTGNDGREFRPGRRYGVTFAAREDYSALDALTPSARMAMVWPLTLQAWAFSTELADEPRLRRDVGRVTRGGR
ncbi:MAG: hypothetical protein IPG75_17130 [Gemmatimonadetes bacterium]|nr:hypothetical protein [Gemmatimonadota bacterium]